MLPNPKQNYLCMVNHMETQSINYCSAWPSKQGPDCHTCPLAEVCHKMLPYGCKGGISPKSKPKLAVTGDELSKIHPICII